MLIAAAILFASTIDLSAELNTAAQAAHLPAIQATVTRSSGIVAHGAAGIVELGRTKTVGTVLKDLLVRYAKSSNN